MTTLGMQGHWPVAMSASTKKPCPGNPATLPLGHIPRTCLLMSVWLFCLGGGYVWISCIYHINSVYMSTCVCVNGGVSMHVCHVCVCACAVASSLRSGH